MEYVGNMLLYRVTASEIEARERMSIHSDQNGFFLCTAGEIRVEMDNNSYTLRAGDMYIYPGFSITEVMEYSNDVQGIVASADFDFVLSLLDKVIDVSNRLFIRFHPLEHLNNNQFNRILSVIELFEHRQKQPTLLNSAIIPAIGQLLLFEVIEAYVTNVDSINVKVNRRDVIFQTFFASLHRHFRTQREVSYYASEQYLTPRYFSTIVHERSGRTPGQWISMFVITEAKRLLSNAAISVKEVANILNFPNQSFFGRYFKRFTGLSPLEYRRQ